MVLKIKLRGRKNATVKIKKRKKHESEEKMAVRHEI
jgi:hypothetical protein